LNGPSTEFMLINICPKLPMRDKAITKDFYVKKLGFQDIGASDYDGYLLIKKDQVEIHFFQFTELDPNENYGQVYIRTSDINSEYELARNNSVNCKSPEHKPWQQIEFSVLDPDHNLLTFGQSY